MVSYDKMPNMDGIKRTEIEADFHKGKGNKGAIILNLLQISGRLHLNGDLNYTLQR